jgi:hypothetical protein
LIAGPWRSKQVADPGREEVLVVAGVAEQEQPDVVDEVEVRQDVVEVVGVGAASGEHADRAVEPLGWVAGVLERLPGRHQEVAVLRVEDRCFLR